MDDGDMDEDKQSAAIALACMSQMDTTMDTSHEETGSATLPSLQEVRYPAGYKGHLKPCMDFLILHDRSSNCHSQVSCTCL